MFRCQERPLSRLKSINHRLEMATMIVWLPVLSSLTAWTHSNSLCFSLVWQPMARTVSRSTTDQASLSTREMLGVHQKGLEGGLTELAVTGKAFNKLCSNGEMQELLLYTRIFSRCTPEDKVQSPSQ